MCNAVVVIFVVVVATFFTVSVLFYSVVFAFSLLLCCFMFYCFIWQGGTRRDVKLINRPWHVGPKSPYSNNNNNNNLGITATKHTHALPSRELRVVCVCVCVFCNLCCCCSFCYCCCLISHFFRHSHTHTQAQFTHRQTFVCKSIGALQNLLFNFRKNFVALRVCKVATTTINNHFFPYSKIYFKWEYQQQKHTHGEHGE